MGQYRTSATAISGGKNRYIHTSEPPTAHDMKLAAKIANEHNWVGNNPGNGMRDHIARALAEAFAKGREQAEADMHLATGGRDQATPVIRLSE